MGAWMGLTAAATLVAFVAAQYGQPQYRQEVVIEKAVYKNYSKPYGNYSSGGSMYGAYTGQPQYPQPQYGAGQYNQSYSTYGNKSYGNQYPQDYWATYWDHNSQGKHNYNQEAFNWVQANLQQAWDYAVATWDRVNGRYYGQSGQCGYNGNPYNDYETRHQKQADLLVFMAEWIWDNYQGDKYQLHKAMLNQNMYNSPIYGIQECLNENYRKWEGTCDQYDRYSRPDQICNNKQYPTWGAWMDILERISLIWNYREGIWLPMQYQQWPSYDGTLGPVPDAKYLANALDNSKDYEQCYNTEASMLHAYYAQYAVHDILYSSPYTVTGSNGKQVRPECCRTPDNCQHHTCTPWKASISDGYGGYKQVCESLSMLASGIDYCTPLAKDATNEQTAYIDASTVYGATCEDADKLRSHRKGKLKVNKGKYGLYAKNILLPEDEDPDTDECDPSYPDPDLKCLMAGDDRNNQHGGIQVMQTMFMRLQNRIASSCAKWLEKYYLSEEVVDEICYQETRRIVIAIHQIIFYRDHMAIELGDYVAKNPVYGLGLDYVLPYDASVHASVWPEYAYGAGRLHTTCSHWNQIVDENKRAAGLNEPDSWYGITDFFHHAYALLYKKHAINELVSNALYDPEQCYDNKFVPEMRNVNPTYGGHQHDMLWVNIMRQREWGMPWYNQVWDWCGMGDLYDWNQLQGRWHEHCLNTLPGIVGHVKNVEFYVGLICEKPMPGALVGPTAGCVLQRQYYNLREGDRFFFDRNGFNYDQIEVLKKFNMGKVVCITTNLDYVTENVFRTPNAYSNKYQSCNSYDDITEDDLAKMWATIPYTNGDYRTCKDYPQQYQQGPQYGNNTYGGYKQNNTYGGYQQQQNNYGGGYQQMQQPQYNSGYQG